MKLEISIKANCQLRQALLTGLYELIPDCCIEEKPGKESLSDPYMLNFLVDTEAPDAFLKNLAAVTAEIEKNLSPKSRIDIHVKNRAGSEPTFGLDKKSQPFSPVKGIRIVPWPPANNIKTTPDDILLDPADAFGNGKHPSTRLCLQLLKQAADCDAENKYPARTVLDIGCGSGILSIAAMRLGASCALGIEIDAHAVETAKKNVQVNRLSDSVRVLETSWESVSGKYDLVLANLVPSVLFKASHRFTDLLNPGGLLITAGFLASMTNKIARQLQERGLNVKTEASLDGWGGLLLTR